MNTSVNIGASRRHRLQQALLIYGTTDHNVYPPRQPFVTTHTVIQGAAGFRLSAGKLLTIEGLVALMRQLEQKVPREVLPDRVMVRTADTIVWWMPASRQTLFFSDRGGDPALQALNGKQYPQPALVFKASGKHLWVRALKVSQRPSADSHLVAAPYWNTYDNGVVCTGSMEMPRDKSVAQIDEWEQSFFRSEFTHAAGVERNVRFPGGLVAMWQTLKERRTFPARYLAPTKQTLQQFVEDDDASYRNRR
jgi:PRTRC genetic system protein B